MLAFISNARGNYSKGDVFLKDAKWISHTGTMKCTTVSDVYLLLKSSNRTSHDLNEAYVKLTCVAFMQEFSPLLSQIRQV